MDLEDRVEYLEGLVERQSELIAFMLRHGPVGALANGGYWMPVEDQEIDDITQAYREFLQVLDA